MDIPLKGFSQNIGLKLLVSERSLVLGNGITLAAFRTRGKLFCSMRKF